VVLAVNGKRELWWIRGGYYSDGLNSRKWATTELTLVEDATDHLPTSRELQKGGRLSYRLIMNHEKVIDAWLGEGTAARVARSYRKATVISTVEPKAEAFCMIYVTARGAV